MRRMMHALIAEAAILAAGMSALPTATPEPRDKKPVDDRPGESRQQRRARERRERKAELQRFNPRR